MNKIQKFFFLSRTVDYIDFRLLLVSKFLDFRLLLQQTVFFFMYAKRKFIVFLSSTMFCAHISNLCMYSSFYIRE